MKLRCFVVTYKGRLCVDVEEYENSDEAHAVIEKMLDATINGVSDGLSGTIYYTSESDPGVKIGDMRAADYSDEMDFQGGDD